MFSLHIDTARSWRGGQNQVLVTVAGLRALGHRTVLVAHPSGELRRRSREGPGDCLREIDSGFRSAAPDRQGVTTAHIPHMQGRSNAAGRDASPGRHYRDHVNSPLDLIPLAPATELDLAAAWRLSRLIKRLQPDIVHAHDPHGVAMAALALSMSTALAKPPLVAARRVDFHLRGSALSRWKYRQVDCYICASQAICAMLKSDGVPAARTAIVHEGIDLERIDAAPRARLHEELWLPHGAPVVGNVAALVPHKGQKHLIDAAALVVRQVPDVRFVIAGEGELRGSLERQIRAHQLEKHVLLLGFRADVISLHKAFDVFVMSSVTEGLGTSLLDAMACGKPIVASAAGGIPEVVEHERNGLLVPIRDAEAMAGAIVRLLGEPALRHQLGETGRALAHERFSIERMVRDTLRVYRRVAMQPHREDERE